MFVLRCLAFLYRPYRAVSPYCGVCCVARIIRRTYGSTIWSSRSFSKNYFFFCVPRCFDEHGYCYSCNDRWNRPSSWRVLKRLKAAVKELKKQVVVLYIASRDPRTPWYSKALAVLILLYLLSPIDLIPDWIPVLGYLGA
jgi:hypothetical protein